MAVTQDCMSWQLPPPACLTILRVAQPVKRVDAEPAATGLETEVQLSPPTRA